LVQMELRPAGRSVCLPLLIFPCTIKTRGSFLVPAHPGGPRKTAVKQLWCVVWWISHVPNSHSQCRTSVFQTISSAHFSNCFSSPVTATAQTGNPPPSPNRHQSNNDCLESKREIIRSVLCSTVCNNCAQCNAHTYEQT